MTVHAACCYVHEELVGPHELTPVDNEVPWVTRGTILGSDSSWAQGKMWEKAVLD